MKQLGWIITGSVVLAVLQAALGVLLAIGMIMLLWGAYTKPRETFGLLGFLLLTSLLQRHPLACVSLFGLLLVAGAALERNREQVEGTEVPTSAGRPETPD